MSEQWSIPVSNNFLWEVTAISTPERWAACGLSVWLSVWVSALKLPLSAWRKKTFRGDWRVTASVAKPRAPCQQVWFPWNCKKRAFWVVWQRRSKGTWASHQRHGHSEGSVLSFSASSFSVWRPQFVKFQGFRWRSQQWPADKEEEPSSTLRPGPLPQPAPAWQWYFQSECKPCYKLKLQRH